MVYVFVALAFLLSSFEARGNDPKFPEVTVPHCDDGEAIAENYSMIQNGSAPIWQTVTKLCWNYSGIVVSTNNSDQDIWQTCTDCGCSNYAHGDVAEAFMAPVSALSLAPRWYYELDVGALTGAFWGGIIHNSDGDEDLYSSVFDCNASIPAGGGFNSCMLNCSSSLIPSHSVRVQNGSTWWSRDMLVNWDLFEEKFRPSDGNPWPHWRANFYRYSYPLKTDGVFNHKAPELTGWSPTYSGTFHKPSRFGKVSFAPKIRSVDNLIL